MDETKFIKNIQELDNSYKTNYWTTKSGERILLSKMELTHFFNCLKLLYNHLSDHVKILERVGDSGRRFSGFNQTVQIDRGRTLELISVFIHGLGKRKKEMPKYIETQFNQIRNNLAEYVFQEKEKLKKTKAALKMRTYSVEEFEEYQKAF